MSSNGNGQEDAAVAAAVAASKQEQILIVQVGPEHAIGLMPRVGRAVGLRLFPAPRPPVECPVEEVLVEAEQALTGAIDQIGLLNSWLKAARPKPEASRILVPRIVPPRLQ